MKRVPLYFMIEFIIAILIFAAGCYVGNRFCHMTYDSLPWSTLKWHQDSLGYRPAVNGTVVKKDEKAFICLRISTDHLEPGQALLINHDDDEE